MSSPQRPQEEQLTHEPELSSAVGLRPARPPKVSSEDSGESEVGVLEQPKDSEPNVPPPMTQEGAPD